MKVRSAVRKLCKDCYIVRRKKVLFCYCKSNPRHKQRQGLHTTLPTNTPLLNNEIANVSNLTNYNYLNNFQNVFIPIRYGFGAASFFIRNV